MRKQSPGDYNSHLYLFIMSLQQNLCLDRRERDITLNAFMLHL